MHNTSVHQLNEIHDLIQIYLTGLRNILGDNLYGVYQYGAATFPDSGPLRDIDLHVIVEKPLNSDEKAKMMEFHDSLERDHPVLGKELDVYYIALEDARKPSLPQHQLLDHIKDESWALHREHMRSKHCIVHHGPDPKDVFLPASWTELDYALQRELNYVKTNLQYLDYCTLNLCRIMYSYETQDVVTSKRASARWAIDKFPEWKSIIETAVKSYDETPTDEDQELMRSGINNFLDFACKHIEKSKQSLK